MIRKLLLILVIIMNVFNSFAQKNNEKQVITLGAGCFWCVETIFSELKGVSKVVSGYSGGRVKNPSYKEVCSGTTGYVEVCQITYNPNEISTKELLNVFFFIHDPTTLNRQGADVGTQYRSVIFYHNSTQKQVAQELKKSLTNEKAYESTIVTGIEEYISFFESEPEHKDYYRLNKNQPYCKIVITPKVNKFRKKFKFKLKE